MGLMPLLDLLVPHRCVSCGRRADPPWCEDCARAAAAARTDPATSCDRCGGPAGRHACWAGTPPVVSLTVVARYGGVVADAIVAGKERGVRGVWSQLGGELAHRVDREAGQVVTWVPAPARRRRRRGFDHAQLLAQEVARGLGRPCARLLIAPASLPDRGSMEAADRPGLAYGAYVARVDLTAVGVVLVDDVVTSGATIVAAAGALSAVGAQVHAAVYARAGRQLLGGQRAAGPTAGRPGPDGPWERPTRPTRVR